MLLFGWGAVKFAGKKGRGMHIYHIVRAYDTDNIRTLETIDKNGRGHNICLDKARNISGFSADADVIALCDGCLDGVDVAYICDGQLYINKRPHILDKYGCGCLIDYVAGGADRAMFKMAIDNACATNGIPVSGETRVNLFRLITTRGY